MPRMAEWTLAAALALSLGPPGAVSTAGTTVVSLPPTADTGLPEFKAGCNMRASLNLPSGTLGVPAPILTPEPGPGPIPPAIPGFRWDGHLAEFHSSAEPDVRYALECSPYPGGGPWSPTGAAAGTNQAGPVTLIDQPGPATQRFHRVAAPA